MVSSKTHPVNKIPNVDSATRIAVAFSGGLDSTALLHSTVAAYGPEHVIALHVNHGLQEVADDWVMHCAHVADSFEVAFDFRLNCQPSCFTPLLDLIQIPFSRCRTRSKFFSLTAYRRGLRVKRFTSSK